MPKISILAPSYNHEKYVIQAIESVLNQTFQDFELIITDDASTDSTVEKISTFTDPRIKLFQNARNRGMCATSEVCWRNSSGEYITWLGTDDMYEPHMLETLIARLEADSNLLGIGGSPLCIDEDAQPITKVVAWPEEGVGLDRYQLLKAMFYQQNYFCAPATMVRRRVIDELGYRKPYLLQLGDMEHWIRILFSGELRIISDRLVRYRFRANGANLSSPNNEQATSRTAFEFLKVLDIFVERITDIDLLLKIFPAVRDHPWPLEERLIPFHLAHLSVAALDGTKRLFAVNLLYQLMSDRPMAEYLRDRCNFDYRDLFDLEAKSLLLLNGAPAKYVREIAVECESLRIANRDLDRQLKDLQTRIAEMAGTRWWKLGTLARRCIAGKGSLQ